MHKTTVILTVLVCTIPAAANLISIGFTPENYSADLWSYESSESLLTFGDAYVNYVEVDGTAVNEHTLLGKKVILPKFKIGEIIEGDDAYNTVADSYLKIVNPDTNELYLQAQLGDGDFAIRWTVAGLYTDYKLDDTTYEGTVTGGTQSHAESGLDFNIAIVNVGPIDTDSDMDGNVFSGTITFQAPEPATIGLLSIGSLVFLGRMSTAKTIK